MIKVFISYSQRDIELARTIKESLEHIGNNVYLSNDDMIMGSNVVNEIVNQIKDSDFVLPLLTENSINSEWVMYEMSTAIGYYQERSKPKVIPIIFDNVSVPESIKSYLYIRVTRNEENFITQRIIPTLHSILGREHAKIDVKRQEKEEVRKNSAKYIADSMMRLRKAERYNKNLSFLCYGFSIASLIGSFLYLSNNGPQYINNKTELIGQLSSIVFGVILFSLLISITRYLFLMGKSFMVESLRNSNRIHAISFGEFYLNAFEDKIEWAEVKEAFQQWNIDTGSSFINQNSSDFDPELLKNLTALLSSIKK
ncbi:toll/interleukin-1 receptor domain-containing protein [Paenibacillus glycanilyticus]|uniref:toll/interleukin-1 receptor domain-containing protein n=1 Tax=Paenibacillus glycanilyticus TaxID=126569 RepID=UPI001910DBE4|nr:toll/interleukin-1 receptor domain-containing protein [Paenibacillus glycanilyticus]